MTAVGEGVPDAHPLEEEDLLYDGKLHDGMLHDGMLIDGAPDEEPDVDGDVDGDEPGARTPHLRVAPTTSRDVLRRRRRARIAVFGVAALSAASMFLLVAFHVFAAQSAFTLDKLDSQLSSEQRQYGLLRERVATLSAPETVAKSAAALGMMRPSEVTLVPAATSASFGSNAGLPAPPHTPYLSIGAGP